MSDQDCGENMLDLLARYDPDTLSWKTSQRCFFEDYQTFSETWPRSGTMRNGIAYRLPTLAHLTVEIESGFWPTPTAMDKIDPKTPKAIVKEMNEQRPGRTYLANLRDQVVWGRTFSEVKTKLFATPTTKANQLAPSMMKHPGCRAMLPTPTARDYKGARKPETMEKTGRNRETNSLPDAVEFQDQPGRLNPTWVEWLMGFPLGWTDLNR